MVGNFYNIRPWDLYYTSKLVCLSKPEDTSLLRNVSISRKLRIRNFYITGPWTYYKPVHMQSVNIKLHRKTDNYF